MPQFILPLLPGEPTVCNNAEGLDVFLCPVNDPYIVARIGEETQQRKTGDVIVCQGEKFRSQDGWIQGLRYLHLGDDGRPNAVINITLRHQGRSTAAVVSNAYTLPQYRRQGLAAGLMGLAQADFPQLCMDNALSAAGAALVGFVPTLRKSPRP